MLRLVVAVTAFVLAILFALLPLDRPTIDYHWEPGQDGTNVPLVLIERVPDELSLTFPCEALPTEDGRLFASTRSPEDVPALTLHLEDTRLLLALPANAGEADDGRRHVSLQPSPGDDCTVELTYDREEGRATLAATGEQAELADLDDDAFELTGLHWTGGTAGVEALVRTTPFASTRNSSLQKATLLAIGLLAIAALAMGVRHDRPRLRRPRWRPHPSEWGMLAVALLVGLVDLPRVDDGRILARARQLQGFDLATNVSTMFENRPVPQRWVYEWVLGNGVGWSSQILVLRSLSLVAAVVAWVLLFRHVLPALLGQRPSRPVLVVAWSVHVIGVVGWFATLRPEPVLALLLVGAMAVIASWPDEPRAWPYTALAACIGLAVATHIIGLVVAFAALPALPRALADLRRRPVPTLTGTAWGGALSFVAVFVGSNLTHILDGVGRFQGDERHSFGVLDFSVYIERAANGTAPMMLSVGLAVAAILALASSSVRQLERGLRWPRDVLIAGAALAPFAMLASPSKWLWHLGVLTPIAVVGWAAIAAHLDRRRSRTLLAAALVSGLVGLLTAWSLRPTWRAQMLGNWRTTALRHVTPDMWASRAPWLFGEEIRWWIWVLLLMVVASLVYWIGRRRHRQTLGGASGLAVAMALAVGTVSVFQLTPPVADALVADDEWTFVRQSVLGLTSHEASCGVPAATPSVRDYAASRADASAFGGLIAGNSRSGLFAPCHTQIGQRDGVWQVPAMVFFVPQAGQRRLRLEHDLVPIGCNSFPQARSEDFLCFSGLEAEGAPLAPTRVR